MEEKDKISFKIVFIGDACTGKTSIIKKYTENVFIKEYKANIGAEYYNKKLNIDGKEIHLDMWDNSGQEKYKSLTPIFAKEASCLLFVYDITNKLSFDNIDNWINFLKGRVQIPYIALIGNKFDLNKKRKVPLKEAMKKAEKYNCDFYEVSALDGKNIDNAFLNLTNKLINNSNKKKNQKENPKENPKESQKENKKENQKENQKENIQNKENEDEFDFLFEDDIIENEESEESEEEDDKIQKDLLEGSNNKIIKCSSKNHKDIDAINYCQNCKIYMCNKCTINHSGLFEDHTLFNLNKKDNDTNFFTGFCKEKNHFDKLKYFCKTHNQLCCAACIAKVKGKGDGKHKDCNVCFLKKIKGEKKNILENNIKRLEELSKNLEKIINYLKDTYKKIEENKENLKKEIQEVFTKIRNTLNQKEDQLLSVVEQKFNDLLYKEDLIKESEKLPNKIKSDLENGKIEEKDWNDKKKLSKIINNCINIENDIKFINEINEKIKKVNQNLGFTIIQPKEEEFSKYLENIKSLIHISYNNK